jgi:Ribonuclease G/E
VASHALSNRTASSTQDPKSKGAFERAVADWLGPMKRDPKRFVVAHEISQGFNRNEFIRTGQLVSWFSLRAMGEAIGVSKNAVQLQIDKLERDVLLAVVTGHQRVSSRYRALTPKKDERDISRDISQPAPDDTYVFGKLCPGFGGLMSRNASGTGTDL